MEEKKETQKQENRVNHLERNIAYLTNIDLQKRDDMYYKVVADLVNLYFDLFEALQVDDSIVHALTGTGELNIEELENSTSLVKNFNLSNKFLTLAENHREVMEEIFGKDIFADKLKLANRNRWKGAKPSSNSSKKISWK